MAKKAYSQFCAKLKDKHLLRHLPKMTNIKVDFANNDYLALSNHPQIIKATQLAAAQYGVGSKASRLVLPQKIMQDFESMIAQDKNHESALLFATGFQANVSLLSALLDSKVLGSKPLVFSDRLNHASMHLGCQLAGAKQIRYRHLDYDHLAFLLAKYQHHACPKFILTESVFGMDGDIADLEKLLQLSKDHHALLYVDEAHATGIFGARGYGLTCEFAKEIDVVMGTFSKALGGSGAYVTCSKALKRYFINRCQGFIYSTAPSLMQVAAMQAAWEMVSRLQAEVKALFNRAATLREQLQSAGFNTGNSCTPIIPIIINDPKSTLSLQQHLAEHGILVGAIRPPSVALKQSRLRIALTLHHSALEIEDLLSTLFLHKKVT